MTARRIRPIARRALARLYHASHHFLPYLRGKVLILMYHRVLSDREITSQFVQPGMYVRHDVFERQVRFLKTHFDIIPLAELLDLWSRKTWGRGRRYCVLTFDDGWVDNYTYAYPILRTHSVPATIFLPTALIGTNQWLWPARLSYLLGRYYAAAARPDGNARLNGLRGRHPFRPKGPAGHGLTAPLEETIHAAIEPWKRQPEEHVRRFIDDLSAALELTVPDPRLLLNWDEIREMSFHGISFGSHSRTHRILTTLTEGDVEQELRGSLRTLRDQHVNHVPVFSYPNGDFTPEIATQVRAAGYQAALTTRVGFERSAPRDLFAVQRIGIHNDVTETIPLFTLHLSGLARLRPFAS